KVIGAPPGTLHMWNLPPPPGFQGLHSDKPLTVYHRHLPHWRQEGATYFVTLRLADSLPQHKLDELAALKQDWERQHPPGGTAFPSRTALLSRPTSTAQEGLATEQLSHEIQKHVERWLDQGMGSCLLKQPDQATFLTTAMHHFDDNHYELDCYVVMPNHAHVIVRPLMPDTHTLEAIVGSWKKYSSRRINQMQQQTGDVWQEE